MKSTGIIRKVDELGRVVIPVEIRRTLNIEEKDALEIYVENDSIILKKHQPENVCIITGIVSDDNISLADGKIILSKKGAQQLVSELEMSCLKEQIKGESD